MKTKLLMLLSLFAALALGSCAKNELTDPDEDKQTSDTGTAKFNVAQVSVQKYGKIEEGNELPAVIPGLFYCNVTASSSLEWNLTLEKDGETFYDKDYAGSKNVSVELPNNTVDQKVIWKLTVTTSDEEIEESKRVYVLNFKQAERPVYFFRLNGWTYGGALRELEEDSIIPAVIPVTENLTAAECYMHVEASPDVEWVMSATKNGQACVAANTTGVGTPEHDPWWRPTDNVETTPIEYVVLFKTENEFVPEDEREIIVRFQQAAADGVRFTVTKWELGGYGIVPENGIIGKDVAGEFYPNISAASTVEWTMTVYRNGEPYGEPWPGNGTANPFFNLPANESDDEVSWKIEITTENDQVEQKTLTLNFTQAGPDTEMETFTVDRIEIGNPKMEIKYGDTIQAELVAGQDADAYSKLYDPNGIEIKSWDAIIYRDGVKSGEVSGSHFWISNNTEDKVIEWKIVYTWYGQEVEFVFYQEAAAEVEESSFLFDRIEGAYEFRPGQSNSLPAVVSSGGRQDVYAKIIATSDVTWTYSVTRNGEVWGDVQNKGEIQGTGDFYFYLTNNDSDSDVTWEVTVTTTADVPQKTQTITIIQEPVVEEGDVSFAIRALEGAGYTITEGYEMPAAGVPGELYMNVDAGAGVEWYITVQRNGVEWTDGQIGKDNKAKGTASRWFKFPEAREASGAEWQVNVITENPEITTKTLTINFRQKAGVFRFDNFGGYTDAMPAIVSSNGDKRDMYIIVYATENLQWTGVVKKNGEEYATITGNGRLTQDSQTSSHVWIPNNTTGAPVTWEITVTTEADVPEKTQTKTIIQEAAEIQNRFMLNNVHIKGVDYTSDSEFSLEDGQYNGSGMADAYINVTSDVSWTWTVYRNGSEHSSGTEEGSPGGRLFWIENIEDGDVVWRIVVSTEADVQEKSYTITLTQKS